MSVGAEELARPWFERWPELYDWELRRFADLGLEASVDVEAKARGLLVISTGVEFKGKVEKVDVSYPSEYPELPPAIFGRPGLLARHQHWFGGNFCLLARPLDDWPARDWGGADLVAERLTALLSDSEAGDEQVRAHEAPMPEPVTSYFNYPLNLAILLPEEALPRSERAGGRMVLRRPAPQLFLLEEGDDGSAASSFMDLFPPAPTVECFWKRIDEPPRVGSDGASVVKWIRQAHPDLLASRPPPPPPRKKRQGRAFPPVESCALVFPEEGPQPGQVRDAWILVLIESSEGQERATLVHAEVVSRTERGVRLAELEGLETNRVLVVGLGSIGGPMAVGLARAGVGELDLVDCERFEFGNTTRHTLGLDYVGLPKASALAVATRRANPFVRSRDHHIRLGDPTLMNGESGLSKIAPLIDAADLVVDATGSHQIAQLLGRLCNEAEVPMVAAWMTEGFYGAEVVRVSPGATCCWNCFATDYREGRLVRAEAGPPSQVVVQGCSHPTTSGPGFDADEAVAVATRLAVQTLQPKGGYPESTWDHAALSFRRPPDDPDYPRFTAEALGPKKECDQCRVAAGVMSAS